MTLKGFLERLPAIANNDWIVLGDGSICIRDRLRADPINVVAYVLDVEFNDAAWEQDELGERAQYILQMRPEFYDRLVAAVTGTAESTRDLKLRKDILKALGMPPE